MSPKECRLSDSPPPRGSRKRRVTLLMGNSRSVPSSSLPNPSLPVEPCLFKPAPSPAADEYSYAALEADATTAYQHVAAKEQSDKATHMAYQRHVKAYGDWWERYQAQVIAADPGRCYIPAFPITCPKVVMFLQYESSRPKLKVHYHVLVTSMALMFD